MWSQREKQHIPVKQHPSDRITSSSAMHIKMRKSSINTTDVVPLKQQCSSVSSGNIFCSPRKYRQLLQLAIRKLAKISQAKILCRQIESKMIKRLNDSM